MYNKRTLNKDTKASKEPKSISTPRDIIYDPMGQWTNPYQPTRVPSSNITMQGVPYAVLGIGSTGQQQMMYPGGEYMFPGSEYVDEFPKPIMQDGGFIEVELDENQIQKYLDGGYIVEEYNDGGTMGDPPPLIEPATETDSISVYQKALDFESKLKELGYTKKDSFEPSIRYIKGFGTGSLEPALDNRWNLIQNSRGWELDPDILKTGTSKNRLPGRIGEGHMYLEKTAPYKYIGNELVSQVGFNTDLPKVYYDSRISPQESTTYEDETPKSQDYVRFLKYNPIAVKPWKMLNESEKKERLERFGTSGTPYDKDSSIIKKEYKPNLDTDLAAWLKTQKSPATYTERKKLFNIKKMMVSIFRILQ